MFTAKHFEFFAQKLGTQLKEVAGDTSVEIVLYQNIQFWIDIFKNDNPNFKEELFQNRLKQYILGEK